MIIAVITVRRVQFLTDRVLQRVRARRCTRKHVNRPVHVQHHLRCRIARSIQKRYRRRNFNPANRKRHFRKVRRKAVQRVVIFNNIAQARTARVSVHRTVTVVLGYNRCGFHLHRDRCCVAVRRIQYLANRVLQRIRTGRRARKHVNRPVRVQHHLCRRIVRAVQERYRRRNFNAANGKRHFGGIHRQPVQRVQVKRADHIVRTRIAVNPRRAVVYSVYCRGNHRHRDRGRVAVRRVGHILADRVVQRIRARDRTRKHVHTAVRVQHHLRRRIVRAIQERYRRRNFNAANGKRHFGRNHRVAVQRVQVKRADHIVRARIAVNPRRAVVYSVYCRGNHRHRDRGRVAVRRVQYLADRVLQRVGVCRRARKHVHTAVRVQHHLCRRIVRAIQERYRRRNFNAANGKRHFGRNHRVAVQRVKIKRADNIVRARIAVDPRGAVVHRVYDRRINRHRDRRRIAIRRVPRRNTSQMVYSSV